MAVVGTAPPRPVSTPTREMCPPFRTAVMDCGSVPGPPTSTTWSTPRPSGVIRAERPNAVELLIRGGCRNDGRAHSLSTLQGEDRPPAGAEHQDAVPGLEPAIRHEGAPG